jgi:RHS repeat-associated protein
LQHHGPFLIKELSVKISSAVLSYLSFFCVALCFSIPSWAQDGQIPPPKILISDDEGVNLHNGQVSQSVETLSIGGAMGLSHSLSTYANNFFARGMKGYVDKFTYINTRYESLGEQLGGFSGVPYYDILQVMRVRDMTDSAEFMVTVNGVDHPSASNVTSNYAYRPFTDERHSLVINGNYLDWTKPDGTVVKFRRGVNPTAGSPARLEKIIYPNGMTIDINSLFSVRTNTGYQLRYFYPADTRPLDKPDINSPYLPLANSSQWAENNPKFVTGINTALDYCADTASSCAYSSQWPTATFNWPAGMPRALYLGESLFSVVDAKNQQTKYHFRAQDLAITENGGVIHDMQPNQRFSPRLAGITPAGSEAITHNYSYKNNWGTEEYQAVSYSRLLDESGLIQSVSFYGSGNGYTLGTPLNGGIDKINSVSLGNDLIREVTSRTKLGGNLMSVKTRLRSGMTLDDVQYETNFRNFPISRTTTTGPSETYSYTRSNLSRVVYNQGLPSQTQIDAEYPSSCTNPKTCNKPLWVSDAKGNRTHYTYHEPSGQVATITSPANKKGLVAVKRVGYEQKQAYFYNESGSKTYGSPIWLKTSEKTCINSATVGDACSGNDEVVTRYEYHHDNLLLTGMTVTADGMTRRTCYGYDQYGNKTYEVAPNANLTSCSGLSEPMAFMSVTRFDVAGRVLGTIAPDPDGAGPLRYLATRNTYNARGLLEKVETGELTNWQYASVTPANWSGFVVHARQQFAYDQYGRKTVSAKLDAGNNPLSLTQTNYDAQSNIKCKTARMNTAAYGSFPYTGLPDACSQGTAGVFGPDRITRLTYDGLDQLIKEERGLGTSLYQTYVTNEYQGPLLRFQTDANGNRTELRYNNYARLEKQLFPSPTTRNTVNENDFNQYTYDANGNRLSERKRNGAMIYHGYDNLNRPILKDLADNTYGADVYFDYDLRGLQLHARFGSDTGEGVTQTFNGFGEMNSARAHQNGSSRLLQFGFDANSNRTRLTHQDGQVFTYEFDQLNRLNKINEGTNTLALTVNYAANGKRLLIERAGGATTRYGFDALLRLNEFEQNFTGSGNDLINGFLHNPAHQITSLTIGNTLYAYRGNENKTGRYNVNGLNQYTAINGTTITHDANANLTSDGSRTFTYDHENRLVRVNIPSQTIYLTYDPLGRLFEYKVSNPGGTTITQFLWDGDALVAEYQNGNLTRRYLHGDQVDEPLIQYNSTQVGALQRRYLHADHQGSIIAQSDSIANVLATLSYDGFGIPKSTNQDRFGYTGQIHLKEIGLWFYKTRVYDPKLGRFLQTDEIGYADDMNAYAYVNNNFLNLKDPTGTEDECGHEQTNCSKTPDSDENKPDEDKNDPPTEEVIVTGEKDKTDWGDVGIDILSTGLIVGDLFLGGPTGEGIVPAMAMQGMKKGAKKLGKAASEKYAKDIAKRIEKDLGKNARRKFHDAKDSGSGDRTKEELIEDAKDLYIEAGKSIPTWLQ